MTGKFFRSAVSFLAAAAPAGAMAASDRPSASGESVAVQETVMKISIEIAGAVISATLDDSQTAMDFASLLPLTLVLEDYAATEKISQLPRRLSTEGAPDAITPQVGDLAYYEPWGNLALFYKGFRRSPKLVKLGTLDLGIELIRKPGPVAVTIRHFGKLNNPVMIGNVFRD